jgi:hypothetical protein
MLSQENSLAALSRPSWPMRAVSFGSPTTRSSALARAAGGNEKTRPAVLDGVGDATHLVAGASTVGGVWRGNARLAAVGLGAAQVVVEVDVADEGGYGGALVQVVEVEDAGRNSRVADIKADTDRGVVDRGHLSGQHLNAIVVAYFRVSRRHPGRI